MNFLRRIFRGNHGWRAGWRFAVFLSIYLAAGTALDPKILAHIHFPERTFTWSSMLLNYLLDFAFLSAIVYLMSRIEREPFSSYGLPLVHNAGTLLWKGVLWGYPQVALLKQIKGVGTLIGLTFLLTLEDPHRFRKSRDVGCYLGLQPGRRNSGRSEPQMHISKEGDPYLRTLLVQGAQHILGPFGVDCDLRRWGLKLAERGGRNGKKRAIVATTRKLAVLLHHLWVSGEVYEPLHNNRATTVAAAA
jgi:hypothetical protein